MIFGCIHFRPSEAQFAVRGADVVHCRIRCFGECLVGFRRCGVIPVCAVEETLFGCDLVEGEVIPRLSTPVIHVLSEFMKSQVA